jgi:membrane protein YqaA with SNARE-associated domain
MNIPATPAAHTTFMEKLKATLVSWGPLGLLAIGVIDGAGLPNPSGPDFLLVIFSAASPNQAYVGAACAVLGSLIGNYILYSIARKGGEVYLQKHTEGPRGRKFREWFHHYGLVTVFIPALVPIPSPLKVFVICAGAFQVHPGLFLATMTAARIPRYFGLASLGRRLGEDGAAAWLAAHRWDFAVGILILGMLLFGLIKLVDFMKKRQVDKLVAPGDSK